MRAFWYLFLTNLRMTYRNKQALFWRLAFPLIFIVIFGLFNLDKVAPSKVVVVDEAQTAASQQIIDGMKKIDFFRIETTDQSGLEDAKSKLKRDEINTILVIPSSINTLNDKSRFAPQITFDPITKQPTVIPAKAPDQVKLEVFYNEANVSSNQIVLNALNQLTTEMNATASGAPQLFAMDQQPLTNKKVRYIDFLVPGVIAMSLMNSSIISIAIYITEQREKKILKRILVAPVDRKSFIASAVLAQLLVAMVQATFIVIASILLYHVHIYGSLWDVALLVALGTLGFINLGFIVAAFAKTADAAQSLAQIITLPMMFLSGVFFSIESLPKIVNKIVTYLPLSPVIEALRKVMINGEGLGSLSHQMYILGGWVIGSFIVALLVFKLAKD